MKNPIHIICPLCRAHRLKDDGETWRCACGYAYTPPPVKRRKKLAKERMK